jgi:hypothetical protein
MIIGCSLNVAGAQDLSGTSKPAQEPTAERIDGIVALIMAIGRALVAQESRSPSIPCSFCDSEQCCLPSRCQAPLPSPRTRREPQAGPLCTARLPLWKSCNLKLIFWSI